MAEKYHVSNETGVPGICKAEPGKCPVNRGAGDDETPHYSTLAEAQAGFENLNKDFEVTSISKEPTPVDELVLENKMSDLMDRHDGSDRSQQEINRVSNELKILRNKKAFDKNMIPSKIKFHNDKTARVAEVAKLFGNHSFNWRENRHPCRNVGQVNPSTLEGSGATYIPKGECSIVLLSKPDGSGVRAIASHGEAYNDPNVHLGEPAVQIKQGKADVERHGFVVIGYVSARGERFGLVPDRQIAAFVYK